MTNASQYWLDRGNNMSKKIIILQNMHVVLQPKQYYYLQCKHLCIAMYVELLHKQCFGSMLVYLNKIQA